MRNTLTPQPQNIRFRSILVLFLIVSTCTVAAQPGRDDRTRPQNSRAIGGHVVDAETDDPIPGATVALYSRTDSSLITGSVTKSDGRFEIVGIRPGEYFAEVASLGYATFTVDSIRIERGTTRVDLGHVRIQPLDDSEVEGVTVEGERSTVEFRADRTIYNVEDQPVTAGGDVVEVLKNVPEVDVDINDNISLRGSQNVVVLLNDRTIPLSGEALAGLLRSLPAEMIEKIEIIPNPSAKYDPDGMAGIINIVMKKEDEDSKVSGTASVSAETSNSYSGSTSLNLKEGIVTLYSGYSFRYSERDSERDYYRENRILDPSVILDQSTEGERIRRGHTVNSTLELSLSDKSNISLGAIGSVRSGDDQERNAYDESLPTGEIVANTVRFSPEEEDEYSCDVRLGYDWIDEPSRHEFGIDARFDENGEDERSFQREVLAAAPDSVLDRQRTETDELHRELSVQADYVRALGENIRVEAGVKEEWNQIANDYYSETYDNSAGEFTPDLDENNEFAYDRYITSVYALGNLTVGDFEAQAGLRAEHAATSFELKTTDEVFDKDYVSLFPSGALAYAFSQKTRLRATYSRRIRRPHVWVLNPFSRSEDRLNIRRGNPYLLPEYTNAFEIGLRQSTPFGTITLSPYYRLTTNEIDRYVTLDSNGVSTLTYENVDQHSSYGSELVASFRDGEWLQGYMNVSLYRIVTDGSNIESDYSNDALAWSARANTTIQIFDGTSAQISWYLRGPHDIANGHIDLFQSGDIALKQEFADGRGSLSLSVEDPFDSRGWSMQREDEDYYLDLESRWASRSARISFSWDFGKRDYRGRDSQMRRSGGADMEDTEF